MARRTEEQSNRTIRDHYFIDSLVWFFQRFVTFYTICVAYYIMSIFTPIQFNLLYCYVLSLLLPGFWCKLRRYRIRDKDKLKSIYANIILAILTQVLIDLSFFTQLYSRLLSLGGY